MLRSAALPQDRISQSRHRSSDPVSAPTADPRVLALSASAPSISAIACGSSTNWVRRVMVETTRELTSPCMYSAATRGSRSRSAAAIRIWPDARRCPTVVAAATSAAAESHPSNAQFARSSLSSTRRRASSAIADRRRAAAAASGPCAVLDRGDHRRVIRRDELGVEHIRLCQPAPTREGAIHRD